MSPTHIAILGGGLSGLSSAFHLARRFPGVPISLLEKTQRLGGWVHSERTQICDGAGNTASIVLEAGPRTLRPHGKSTLELINLLKLEHLLLTVPHTSLAARNRFLHIPGIHGLTMIPSSLPAILSSPLSRILVPAVISASLRTTPQLQAHEDLSVDQFLTIHFGVDFARTFGSALVHGIYAADSRQLSVRAAFPSLWDAAIDGKGSVVRGFIRKALRTKDAVDDELYQLDDVSSLMRNVSVYSFKEGMETITRAISRNLDSRSHIEIITGDAIRTIERSSTDAMFKLVTDSGRCLKASHVVSALPMSTLAKLAPSTSTPTLSPITKISRRPVSTVTVVNIVFPPTTFPIHPPGFGYLVPRPRDDASKEEIDDHAGVLGVVFDSCALPEQDLYPSPDSPRFTKVTMMLGGPHVFSHTAESVKPDRLLRILTRHLAPSHPLPDPVLIRAHHLTGCIPTPAVGHLQRVQELKAFLQESEMWQGRLEVVGAGVGGVSVPDCIEQGRHVGSSW
ncbi:Protoporphyrinogen oxidase [Cristinia sonorae]|uniref:Protoporphyrinogen oxidase n=1 Tax=Cristinia sonorae TaxID=1940300 RepID=A0A8K0UUQ3_9AGAR|nr:Protoporphyrinogen oxidase [Cristinia sonorae]